MNRLFSPEDDSVGRIHDQLAYSAKIKPAFFGAVQLLTREELSVLIETAFWASLRSNEGRTTRACVAVAAPESFHDAVAFAIPIAYDESQIAKLAPAVPQGGCLLVSPSGEGFNIWGFGRTRPVSWQDTVALEVSEPGIVRVNLGVLQPFAVLNGRSNPIIEGTNLAHYLMRVLQKALPADDVLETQAVWRECLVLAILARMIATDGHGGIILIVPTETGVWAESLKPFAYQFMAPDTRIRDGIRQELNDGHAKGQMLQRLWEADVPDELKNQITGAMAHRPWYGERDVRAIASLAGVDGAIVMTRDLRVLGFGAKLAGSAVVEQVCVFRSERGTQQGVPEPLKDVGGTRHQSSAQFIAGNADTVAVVISHDRHMSLMYWDDSINYVAVVRNVEWWA